MFVCLILSQRSETVLSSFHSFFFILFCSSYFTILSFMSLIRSSASVILLLIPSRVFFVCVCYAGLSLLGPLPLRSTGSGRAGSAAMAHGPSRSVACGIFLDRGTNTCPLHRQVDSQPLCHQGSPVFISFHSFFFILLCSRYFHYFIFLVTYPFFCLSSSAIDSF